MEKSRGLNTFRMHCMRVKCLSLYIIMYTVLVYICIGYVLCVCECMHQHEASPGSDSTLEQCTEFDVAPPVGRGGKPI